MMKRLAKSKQFDVYKSTPELNMPEEKTIKSSSGNNLTNLQLSERI